MTETGIINGNAPYLYGEKLKAYLTRGAKPLPVLSDYPNPALGWGFCACGTVCRVVQSHLPGWIQINIQKTNRKNLQLISRTFLHII